MLSRDALTDLRTIRASLAGRIKIEDRPLLLATATRAMKAIDTCHIPEYQLRLRPILKSVVGQLQRDACFQIAGDWIAQIDSVLDVPVAEFVGTREIAEELRDRGTAASTEKISLALRKMDCPKRPGRRGQQTYVLPSDRFAELVGLLHPHGKR